VSPKPASGIIFVKIDERFSGEYSLSILDMKGSLIQKIDNIFISNAPTNINISSLPGGSYIIKIVSDDRVFSKVIIKLDK